MSPATISDLAAAVRGPARSGAVIAYGMPRSYAAYAAAQLRALAETSLVVVVVPDEASARAFAGDAALFAGSPVLHIPVADTSPYTDISSDRDAIAARLAALFRLQRGGALAPAIAVLSAASMLRRVVPRDELGALATEIRVGADIDLDDIQGQLIRAGYTRVPLVEDPGTFAVRGGVLDVFVPLYRHPARVDLFGDTVETLGLFDASTQRTQRALGTLHIHPVRETVHTRGADLRGRVLAVADAAHHPSAATRLVLENLQAGADFVGAEGLTPAFHAHMEPVWRYLTPHAPVWLVVDPDAIGDAAQSELDDARARYDERLADGQLAFAPEEHYVTADELADALGTVSPRVEARSLEVVGEANLGDPPPGASASLRFSIDDNHALRAALAHARKSLDDELLDPLVAALGDWRRRRVRVAIACSGAVRAETLARLLAERGMPTRVHDARDSRTPRQDGADDDIAAAVAGDGPSGRDALDVTALDVAAPTLLRGELGDGFTSEADGVAILSADDVFGPRRRSTARQRAAAKRARAALLGGVSDFSQLDVGDFVVHEVHGVGQYRGLVKLPLTPSSSPSSFGRGDSGVVIDFVHLEYRGGVLYLPVYRLGEIQRYVGAHDKPPRLDKLGGQTWQTARRKVSRQIRALAEELLQLYAQRAALPGTAFPAPDAMFREFEATFPFDETPDQQRAIDEVLADMERPKPMDRLVCGDVGYGKTEVAMRALFKAVCGGAQAALLAPTTVLVEQHYRTLRERFAGLPVEVARLSRFQSRADQTATVAGLASGAIDVVVGTHRLLSADVRFKELGLLVIDEEQRFGVAHKEKLKRYRTQIDVLTLTATPIPRTLHLAMSGLRDLSIIATPPADRRAVRTLIARPDDGVLREGIRRELARGGQVFFVAPRIGDAHGAKPGKQARAPGASARASAKKSAGTPSTIRTRRTGRDRTLAEWAARIREIVPEARVAVAHGQMTPAALEDAMVSFVAGDANVLVSTAIVENGLDIPRANTMFVARADIFGTSQLYQLRGRIGRSNQRAFCYLLVPSLGKLTPNARRRLEALQRFSDLGAGFQIASHDLEIRGGGELLGARQSGAIASVGFDAYIAMLEEAVAELKGQPIHRIKDPVLTSEVPGFIPDDYIPDTGQRLDLYKRLASADDADEVAEIEDEMRDRYGDPPPEVDLLCELMVVKTHARRLGADSLAVTGAAVSITLRDDTPLPPDRISALVASDRAWRITPDMRLVRTFTDEEAEAPAAAARRLLLNLVSYVT